MWLTLTPRPTLVLWWVDEKGLLELDGFWADEEKTEEIGLMGSLATELTRVDDTCMIRPAKEVRSERQLVRSSYRDRSERD
jgi:hypothetical protein